MGLFKGLAEEKRKTRWSNPKKSTKVFFATIITILLFVLFVSLFSWGIAAVLNLAA